MRGAEKVNKGYRNVLIGVFLLVGYDLWKGDLIAEVAWKIFGLSGESTAYDYNVASFNKQSVFDNMMCNDGVCLAQKDWRCGFTIEDLKHSDYSDWNEAVRDCFAKMVTRVEAWTKLDKIRMICGRHFMQFHPRPSENAEQCKAAGGEWGKSLVIWLDEAELLTRAGIK